MNTISKETDIWSWNKIISYDSLSINEILSPEKTVVQVQKTILPFIDIILKKWFWIEKNISSRFWRSWVSQISLKEYWDIIFIISKWTDSVETFAPISDYYIWWSDIVRKMNAVWKSTLTKIVETPGEVLWKYKTELLLLIGKQSISSIWDINNIEIEKLYTKFSPILTQYTLSKIPEKYKTPHIQETDSNSELAIQISEREGKVSWAVEIIQSGKSVVSTNNCVIQNGKIYKPGLRSLDTGKFTWEIIWEVSPNSQVWMIANGVQTEINIYLCKFESLKWYKNGTFINFIKDTMKNIK